MEKGGGGIIWHRIQCSVRWIHTISPCLCVCVCVCVWVCVCVVRDKWGQVCDWSRVVHHNSGAGQTLPLVSLRPTPILSLSFTSILSLSFTSILSLSFTSILSFYFTSILTLYFTSILSFYFTSCIAFSTCRGYSNGIGQNK